MDQVLLVIGDAAEVTDTLYPYFRVQEEGYRCVLAAPEKRVTLRSSVGCAANLMGSVGLASAIRSLAATGCGLARLVATLARCTGAWPVATAAKSARSAALSSEPGFAPFRASEAVS